MTTLQIPDEWRHVLEVWDAISFLTQSDFGVAVLAKVSEPHDSFAGAPVKYWYELALYEEGPVLCMIIQVLDKPDCLFTLETFLDVAKPEDLAHATGLAAQHHFDIHFLNADLEPTLSKRVRHKEKTRAELEEMIRRATQHLEHPTVRLNWYAARQRFMREVKR